MRTGPPGVSYYPWTSLIGGQPLVDGQPLVVGQVLVPSDRPPEALSRSLSVRGSTSRSLIGSTSFSGIATSFEPQARLLRVSSPQVVDLTSGNLGL